MWYIFYAPYKIISGYATMELLSVEAYYFGMQYFVLQSLNLHNCISWLFYNVLLLSYFIAHVSSILGTILFLQLCL